MNGDSSTKRELETNGNGHSLTGDEVAIKRVKLSNGAQVKLKGRLSDSEVTGHLQRIWNGENGTKLWMNSEEEPENSIDSSGLRGSKTPFRFIEVKHLLEEPEALTELQDAVVYDEKLSDLFRFKQSPDLLSLGRSNDAYPIVQSFKSYFSDELLPALKDITGINLNGKFDIFASQYTQGDFLLCHDDELEDRRIAFILYMSKNYEESFGGTLDLYTSIDLPDGQHELPVPHEIVESIIPEFNKLVFFEVSARSFHQVREVIHADADRRAISGWFYGEPLPRPAIILPEESYKPLDYPSLKASSLDHISPSYLDDETLEAVNATLSENSEIMLQAFLKPETLNSITNELKMISELSWENAGPPNLQSFQEISFDSDCFPKELSEFFSSTSFLEFLERLTEFPFTSVTPGLKFRGSLKKFSAGSYTLVRGKLRHQPSKQHESIDLVSDSENEAEAAPSDDNTKNSGLIQKAPPPKDENIKDKDSDPTQGSSSNSSKTEKPESSTGASNSAAVTSTKRSGRDDSKDDNDSIQDEDLDSLEGSDEEPPDPAPNHIDVIMYFTPTLPETDSTSKVEQTGIKWEEAWGGTRIYTDDFTGDQLVKVCPEGNTLAVIVRDESISSHYSYVNCLAKDHYFYAVELEFSFPTQEWEMNEEEKEQNEKARRNLLSQFSGVKRHD